MEDHMRYLNRAVELALEAEQNGNIPVGALMVLDGEIIAEGRNGMLVPDYNPHNHGEIMMIKSMPSGLWDRAADMTCYTTLEPCIMCFSTLLLHGVGRIVYGASDTTGGCSYIINHLPPYYDDHGGVPVLVGPVAPDVCDPLFHRVLKRFKELPCG
jgi:tRNA(adenine34) deaminase